MADRVGTEIAGYRIEGLIGRGGMSVVYLAEHVRLGRKVALKLLSPELAENEKFRERFLRESQIAASIDHPNIVPIYDSDEAEGTLFIAMRYVQGTDLRGLIRSQAPLEPSRVVSLVTQIASALDAAHMHGLVHRDVKPGNVLLTHEDHVYVADFGLTKRALSVSGLTETGQLVGTIDYIAPEQAKGDPVDGRADVYSLGCLAYECLTGEVPFERDTEVAVLWAHVQESPPKPSAMRPDLPTRWTTPSRGRWRSGPMIGTSPPASSRAISAERSARRAEIRSSSSRRGSLFVDAVEGSSLRGELSRLQRWPRAWSWQPRTDLHRRSLRRHRSESYASM
jgi:serine/threonine protein kinase